jgi:UDP-N-acetylglucosamine pyrophosphorylase
MERYFFTDFEIHINFYLKKYPEVPSKSKPRGVVLFQDKKGCIYPIKNQHKNPLKKTSSKTFQFCKEPDLILARIPKESRGIRCRIHL